MKLLLTGGSGQLGTELRRRSLPGWELVLVRRDDVDICQLEPLRQFVRCHMPAAIVNAAAYTAVDKAESEPEQARAVNARAAANLAHAAEDVGARLIHISTDYVFDGTKATPYLPGDRAHPLSVYGLTKYEGEKAVLAATGGKALVLRTSWLYASCGENFVKTMLRQMGVRENLSVVSDQVGTPTWAASLAACVERALECHQVRGIHHWTDAGVASWYDFALAIQDEARALNLLQRAAPVRPIRTEQYPVPAARPMYSVLDKTATWEQLALEPVHWRESLRSMLKEMAHA